MGSSALTSPTNYLLGQAPLLPIAVLLTTLAVALLADLAAPHSATITDLDVRRLPPAFTEGGRIEYFLGTDVQGRDVLSRIIVGTRVSLSVAAMSIVVGGLIGTTLGLVAGYWGGLLDAVLMRFVDVVLAFPPVLMALILAITLGPGFWVVVAILGVVLLPRYARLVRGEVHSWKRRDFVALARVAGCSSTRIIAVHIVPNILSSLIVLSTLQVGWLIVSEASLSFLGVGIPGPTATWGGMVAEGMNDVRGWWVSVFPGVVIVLVVLSFNVLGDHIRDVLDPRLRQL